MRLAWLGHGVWDVLAVEDKLGKSVRDDLRDADPSDSGAERMLATVETEVPLNGPPRMNKNKCRDLGGEIFEFKEPGIRVLWFYDAGEPVRRRRIICTHSSKKVSKKEFQPEIARAKRIRQEYIAAKLAGQLIEAKWVEE